jgi:hypothetical protein
VLNYTECSFLRSHHRFDKIIGKRLRGWFYLRPIAGMDAYEVLEVTSRHKQVLSPKNEWKTRTIAEIDRTGIHFKLDLSCLSNKILMHLWGIEHWRLDTKLYKGRVWYVNGVKYEGYPSPTFLASNGLQVSFPERRVRVHREERRKKLNALIKSVKQLITVRYKLGAFANVTAGEVRKSIHGGLWESYGDPKQLHKALSQANAEDIASFYPIFSLSLYSSRMYYRDDVTGLDWVKLYASFITSIKERLRVDLKAVEYVPESELTEDDRKHIRGGKAKSESGEPSQMEAAG